MPACQTKIAQRCFQAFTVDPSLTESNLVDAGVAIRCHAVSHTVDDEHANARDGQEAFPRPFHDQLGRHHRDHGEASSLRCRENARERNQSLASAALCDGGDSPAVLPFLQNAHHSQLLTGEGLALQLSQEW